MRDSEVSRRCLSRQRAHSRIREDRSSSRRHGEPLLPSGHLRVLQAPAFSRQRHCHQNPDTSIQRSRVATDPLRTTYPQECRASGGTTSVVPQWTPPHRTPQGRQFSSLTVGPSVCVESIKSLSQGDLPLIGAGRGPGGGAGGRSDATLPNSGKVCDVPIAPSKKRGRR